MNDTSIKYFVILGTVLVLAAIVYALIYIAITVKHIKFITARKSALALFPPGGILVVATMATVIFDLRDRGEFFVAFMCTILFLAGSLSGAVEMGEGDIAEQFGEVLE